jgi:hypothetical protein
MALSEAFVRTGILGWRAAVVRRRAQAGVSAAAAADSAPVVAARVASTIMEAVSPP